MKAAIENPTQTAPALLFEQGKEILNTSKEEGISLIQEAIAQAEHQEVFDLLIDILVFLSRTYRFQGNYFESMEYLNKSYRKLNQYIPHDQYRLAFIFKEFSSLYADGFEDFSTGLEYSKKSLRLNVEELKESLLNNIGCQYIHLKEYEKAHSFLNRGRAYCLKHEKHLVLCFIYENYGNLFRFQKEYSKATEYYNLGLKACENAHHFLDGDKTTIDFINSYICIGLAENYLESNQLDPLPGLIQNIKDLGETSNLQSALSQAYLLEGKLLLKKNEYKEFENLFYRSVQFCAENSFFSNNEEWLKLIIEVYEKQGRYKDALTYSQLIITNRDDRKSKTINFSNILESKEHEILDLENRNREIQLQKEQLEQFAYIVAHDLKTPLSNISNFIRLIRKKYRYRMDEKSQFHIDFVSDQSKHMQEMLDDLLQYITVKESEGTHPEVELKTIMKIILENYTDQIESKNAIIEFPNDAKIKVQPFHFEVILNNLIKNALKFTKEDTTPRIDLKLEENSNVYQIEVADNGIGIEEQYHEKIFEVFRQLDTKNYQGTGIGLSICKKIVQSYGGKIWVKTNQSGGASFFFTIPKQIIV